MNKGSKILLIIVLISTVCVVGFKYVQFYINEDFTFLTQVNCDPQTEECFRITEDNRDFETSVIFMDGSPYKYVEMPAYLAPACLEETTCPDFTCEEVGEECTTYYCDPEDPELDTEWEECVEFLGEEAESETEEAE